MKGFLYFINQMRVYLLQEIMEFNKQREISSCLWIRMIGFTRV